MTSYVVDASVLIQHFVSEPHTANADALLTQVGETVELYVPEFCLLECTNVLWKHVRFQGVSQSEAEELVGDIAELNVAVVPPVRSLLRRALEIGLKHQLAVYDSVYIALAEQLTYPLITDDGNQADAALAEGLILKPLTDFEAVD